MDNFGGIDWSGSGWSSKEVLNEINSIPQGKPPPKFSTTRAQPRNHIDLNNIVEGDFHYHNKIENVDQNSVQIDDFYYDYNFINFHEDLSDDFESDGKDHTVNAPQEDDLTNREKEYAISETTRAPMTNSVISTVSKTTAVMLNPAEPQTTDLDKVKDGENAATKEPVQTNSETLDDILSEDYLLPVSTTHSPPMSTNKHSQTLKETHDSEQWPESSSTMPRLDFTTKEPTQDVKWEQHGEQAENIYEDFTEEEHPTVDVTMTPKHVAPTPRHHRIISSIVFTTVRAQGTETRDDYEYSLSTPAPDVSVDHESAESPEPEGSPRPETVVHVKTEVHLDKSVSIPQTISPSIMLPTAFTLKDLDQTFYSLHDVSKDSSWDTDLDLSTPSLPVSQKSTPLPIPSLLSPGNREASEDSTSLTGIEIIPPTDLEGATQPPPADFLPAQMEHTPTKPAVTETTGTDHTPREPLLDLADFDYNEIVVPPKVSGSGNSDPGLSHGFPTNPAVTSQHGTRPAKPTGSPTPAVLLLPTPPPSSASTQVATTAFWVTSDWSAVSPHTSPHTLSPSCVSLFMALSASVV